MTSDVIKVGFLISYDYEYLKNSLPQIYQHADTITVAIDAQRKTWAGKNFEIADSFFEWIKEFDTQSKIDIYQDTFHIPELAPIECETRERNMLAAKMGEGGWHVQIDADENFLDFAGFVKTLKSLDYSKPTIVTAMWLNIFKVTPTHMFLIDSGENTPVATNCPDYNYCRSIGVEGHVRVETSYKLLHQGWGRSDAEMIQKLTNWGHCNDFDTTSYLNFWRSINIDTYKYIKDFHPIAPAIWPSLEAIEATEMAELIEKMARIETQKEHYIVLPEPKRGFRALIAKVFGRKRYRSRRYSFPPIG